jgi:hypothetical protein
MPAPTRNMLAARREREDNRRACLERTGVCKNNAPSARPRSISAVIRAAAEKAPNPNAW